MISTLVATVLWPGAGWFGAGLLLGALLGWLVCRLYSARSLSQHAREIRSLSVQARTDGLTGLANRRVLEDEFVRRLALWREQKTPLVLVLADVDHFKRINDEHGHAAGDAALRHLASVMTGTLRQSDLVARFGGDEFAMLLATEGEHAAPLVASRIVRAFADAPPLFDGLPLPVTVSFGATSPLEGASSAELFRRADAALKSAKEHGRDCAFFYGGTSAAELAI